MSHPGNTTRITDDANTGDGNASTAHSNGVGPDARGEGKTEVRSAHGQPRPSGLETVRLPSAAERTRTLVQGTASAVVLVPGLEAARQDEMAPRDRIAGSDGDLFLLFAADTPAARTATHAEADDLPAVLEITDVAPVAVPDRIRGRARISGWLTAARELPARPGCVWLRLEVGGVWVDDLWGAEPVEPEAFAAAQADPLVAHEAELLQHLASSHAEQMGWLCALAGDAFGSAPVRAAPLALDRFGLRVRFTAAGSPGEGPVLDARLEFLSPVRGPEDLHRAMHALFEAAYEAYEAGGQE